MNIFKQSFPYSASVSDKLKTALGFGLFVSVFLLVFKPFGLIEFPMNRLWIAGIGYGLITFGCLFVTLVVLPFIFPRYFKEDEWTTGKQIIHTIVVIVVVGLVNYLFSPRLVDTNYSLRDLLWFQGITLSIALLPVIIFTLWKQNSLLRKFEQQAGELEKKLKQKPDLHQPLQQAFSIPEEKDQTALIELTGDYHGERIQLHPDSLYFIAAANNYIKVYFTRGVNDLKPSYSIIRMTMKKAGESLEPWSCFFRCHRAFIINLDKVEHVEGNAQGYRVWLTGTDESIPVSRNLNTEFSDKLLALRSHSNL